MKTLIIMLASTLLAGCVIVPVAPYDAYYDPYYSAPYYTPPVYGYYGYGYYRPWYNGYYYGPRYHGYYRGRAYGYPGGYRHRR
jgi:hypothetical protein